MTESKNKAAGNKTAEPEINSQQIDDLASEERQKAILEIEGMSVEQFRQHFGELYSKIANDVLDRDKQKNIEETPGFLLELEDPFARAVEAIFTKSGGVARRVIVRKVEESKLPMIMVFSDPATKIALRSYLHRAEGSGDTERSRRAKAALQRCK